MLLDKFIKSTFQTNEVFSFDVPIVEYKKGELITNLGDIESNIYFVVSGVVESYMKACNAEQQDNIIEFTFTDDFVTSLTSLLKQTPSEIYLQCLTDCTLQVISYEQLLQACETSLWANKFYRNFIENYYLTRIQKAKDTLMKTADQRYWELINDRPKIVREIPLGHIARYIGVHPNSLSRIRRKIFTTKRRDSRELEAA